MEMLEGIRQAEVNPLEAALAQSLETNRQLINNVSVDGSPLALQILPGMFHLEAMSEDYYNILKFQLANLLGEANNRIKDVFHRETSANGEKAVGTTHVYELPTNQDDRVYLAVNYGSAANNGTLTLTASKEHPLEMHNRQRTARIAGSNPVRSLFASFAS